MPTIYLTCGLPGSGKTTQARRLEAELLAIRFNEDEWASRLYHPEDAHDNDKRDAIKDRQWSIAVRAVRLGVEVVLDWGVWARVERDDYRSRAAADGVPLKLIYLDVPRPRGIGLPACSSKRGVARGYVPHHGRNVRRLLGCVSASVRRRAEIVPSRRRQARCNCAPIAASSHRHALRAPEHFVCATAR